MLNPLDCEGITHLMKNGFTLQEALDLLETKENQVVFQNIRSKLELGYSASSFFSDYFPKMWKSYFNGLIQFTNFSDALQLCNAIVIGQTKQRKEYEKALLYPSILFVVTFIGVILFNEFCFPPLLSMMQSFNLENPTLWVTRSIIRIVCISIFVFLLFTIVFTLFFLQEKHIVKAYCQIAKINIHSIFVQYASNEFIFFFLQCVQKHISTKKTLKMMQSLTNKPILTFLSKELENAFMHGEQFETAIQMPWIDPLLYKYLKIALYSSNMEHMLQGYLEISKENITKKSKRITQMIQLLSYASIGIILILVYQILMLPLQLLSQI